MRHILTLIFLLTSTFAFAQFSPKTNGKASFSRFLKTTTMVLLTEDECVDQALQRYFKENWTLTPVEFIYKKDYNQHLPNDEYTFVTIDEFKLRGEKKLFGAMALFYGDILDLEQTYLNSSLAYVAYDSQGLEKEIEDLCYKISAMISQLERTVTLINENNLIVKNKEDLIEELTELYNKEAYLLKKETLLINERYKNSKIISVPELESLYNYTFEFVSKEVIEQAIYNREAGKAVLFSNHSIYKTNLIMDCSTQNVIYSELEMPDELYGNRMNQFDNEDMLDLNKVVKKSKQP